MRVIKVDSLKYNSTVEGLVDSVLTTTYPRKCDNCGCGMSQGYVVGDVGYICEKKDCEEALTISLEQMGYSSRDEAYEDDAYFYTEWYYDEVQDGDIVYTEKGEELKVKLCTTTL